MEASTHPNQTTTDPREEPKHEKNNTRPIEIIHNHPCYRRRTKDVEFSSSYCPATIGLPYTCELPFGYIVSPFSIASSEDIATVEDEIPIVCVSCLSYFNIYSEVMNQGAIWICGLCQCRNAVPIESLGLLGLCMSSHIVEYRTKINERTNNTGYILVIDENLPKQEIQSIRDTFHEYITSNETLDGSHTIVFGLVTFSSTVSMYQVGLSGIASANVYNPDSSGTALSLQQQDLKERSFLGYNTDGFRTMYQCLTALCSSTTNNGATIVEEGNEDRDTHNIHRSTSANPKYSSRKEYLLHKQTQKLQPKQPNQRKKKHKYRCTGTAIRLASELALSLDYYEEEEANYESILQNCRILLFTNGCPNLGVGTLVKPQPKQAPQQDKASIIMNDKVDPTYQSMAMEYYKSIGKESFQNQNTSIGIDVFCSGTSSTLGIPAFLTLVSASGGYAIPHSTFCGDAFKRDLCHVLTFTYMSVGVASMQKTLEWEGIDTDNAAAAMGSGLGSSFDEDEEGLEYGVDANQLKEFALNGCLLDIRLPSFIESTQTIGPGVEINLQPQELDNTAQLSDPTLPLLPFDIPSFTSAYERSSGIGILPQQYNDLPSHALLSTTLTRIQMGRYDPLSTFSSILHVTQQDLPNEAVFQYILRYISKHGCTYITRVYTYRLPVAQDVTEFVKGIDEEVMPVLLGREAVLRCFVNSKGIDSIRNRDMEETLSRNARKDLDFTVHRISTTFRKIGSERYNSDTNHLVSANLIVHQSSQDFAFPPELSTSLHLLHHLRRGPLLDLSLYSLEDRASLRSLFLRLPLHDCLMIMAPNLWSIRLFPNDTTTNTATSSSCDLIPIPPETLVLWDNVIIASDNYDSLFLWSGRAVTSQEYNIVREQCQEHLQIISRHRFPQPDKTMYSLYDGDSMSRHFTCRLVPTHLDPPEYQVAHFPDLTLLTTQDMMSLRGKFRFFGDGGSDEAGGSGGGSTFRKWFWSVASVSSKMDGTSLCE